MNELEFLFDLIQALDNFVHLEDEFAFGWTLNERFGLYWVQSLDLLSHD